MEIFAVFMIIIMIGFLVGFIGILMDNDLVIVGFSISIIMMIVLLLFFCFGMLFYGNNIT